MQRHRRMLVKNSYNKETNIMNFQQLAQEIIAGKKINETEAIALLQTPDSEIFDLIQGAWKIRKHHFKNSVHLCTICNAKSGQCSEDCSFCSQSAHGNAKFRYIIFCQNRNTARCKYAEKHGINRYALRASGRGLDKTDISKVTEAMSEMAEKPVNIVHRLEF